MRTRSNFFATAALSFGILYSSPTFNDEAYEQMQQCMAEKSAAAASAHRLILQETLETECSSLVQPNSRYASSTSALAYN